MTQQGVGHGGGQEGYTGVGTGIGIGVGMTGGGAGTVIGGHGGSAIVGTGCAQGVKQGPQQHGHSGG